MGNFLSLCVPTGADVDATGRMIQLKGQRDELEEYRILLRNRIRDLDATIVNHYQSGEKDQAFWLLRKKGLLQTQLSRVDGYLYRVLGVISDNEMAQVNMEVYKYLKIGADLLTSLSESIHLDDIELMRAAEERYLEKIGEAHHIMNRNNTPVEEDELLEVLERLSETVAEQQCVTRLSNTSSEDTEKDNISSMESPRTKMPAPI
ncbi:hypothetical protein X943_002088 [Babesia divergens]|uniref:Uncharacterized protein n=1 Tax=Babesia divergens TaxID=32595 RepID=A0AAD9GEE4_BABDI|nr:hypothetical protein X943_002088 [Babesia divergens]